MLAIAGLSMNAMAQEDPTLKYSVATNSFWSNWFIQANVNYSASWAGTDKIFQNPFYKFPLGTALTDVDHDTRTALGFSLAIGKWFTQVSDFVLRLPVFGWVRLSIVILTSISLLTRTFCST